MNKEMTKGKNKEKLKEKSIDIEKYETIFDHNITDEELENSYITSTRSKEEYLKKIKHDQNRCYCDLSDLYRYRKDYDTAKKYFYMQSEKYIKEHYNPYNDTFTGDIEIKGVIL